jgi:hypothetical protein
MADKDDTVLRQIAELRKLTVGGLKEKYLEVFGEGTNSRNKKYLFKKIAYRIQEKKYGGLSQRARDRAAELVHKAPLRRGRLGKAKTQENTRPRDPRLPAPGTVLTRTFGKRDHTVKVLEGGFEYKGKPYQSLSAVAREITGTSWNGYTFFALSEKETA